MRKLRTLMRIALLAVGLHVAEMPAARASEDGSSEDSNPKDMLAGLEGRWKGVCRTWFRPGELADESPIEGEFESVLGGLFLRHSYSSTIEGHPRAGEETLAFNAVTKNVEISWMDDFHMNYAIMFSEGKSNPTGFTVLGSYDVARGAPSWGWRTVYEIVDDDHLTITSYNVTPDGQEARAVETAYERVSRVDE